ncbi:uncharacterized protein [Asterias amurensis]|uniref:uncharacterized protein n=1 Tax=Asterias amurensis TaxID=7602 RepID=UPI003AB77DBA
MTFGMYFKTTPVFLSSKTNHSDKVTEEEKPSSERLRCTRRSARLPQIRVEECGLTVDVRQKQNGRKQQTGRELQTDISTKTSSLRKGDKNKDVESQNTHHRDRWMLDANDASNGQSVDEDKEISTEFVDSLRIGKVGRNTSNRGQALLSSMEPRPVPKMRYSNGAPINSSIADAVNTFRSHRAVNMGAVSSRERVIIRRLAAKRSETTVPQEPTSTERRNQRLNDRLHRSSWRDRRHNSLEDTWRRKHKRSGSTRSDEFDFELTYKTSEDIIRELRSRSGADVTAGDILDKSSRSTPGEGSGRSAQSDDMSTVHSVDCPMCLGYEPSMYGHICPPNTPHDMTTYDEDI